MKNLLSLAVFGCISMSATAFELPYNNLKKSYEQDYDKTLDRAETWMKLTPNHPAPYYYASLVHFEQAQKQTTIRKRYFGLIKSLKYARTLEELEDADFLDRVAWDTLTPHIQSYTLALGEELKEADQTRLSEVLEIRSRKFAWMIGSNHSEDLANVETEEMLTSEMRGGQYFGLPSGQELVSSHNIRSEREMVEYINKERVKQGMQPFEWNEDLARAARYHAFDMGSQNYFDHDSHDRSNGKLKKVGGTFTRIRSFYNTTFVNSENIAAGNEGAHDTYMQWYNSKGHYENMFNKSSAKIGVGVVYVPGSAYGYYWVMCTALN